MLLAAVDVEHFARVKTLRLCEEYGEDGYSIVAEFLSALNHSERNRVLGGLNWRAKEGAAHDVYTGDLIAKYGVDELPIWALLEVLEFGPFLSFYKFGAERWSDKDMVQEHYVLKSVKSLRNACAHNNCIVNGFNHEAEHAGYRTPVLITDSLNCAGIKNSKARRAKLGNARIAQLAATLFAVSTLCSNRATARRHAARMADLRAFVCRNESILIGNDGIVSFLDFLWKLVDVWLPSK